MICHLPDLSLIIERLQLIFPKGMENRTYLTRQSAAHTVFVLFYCGAVEGTDRWIRPDQVTLMSDSQARRTSDAERDEWIRWSLKPKKSRPGDSWYGQNSREQIRDENIKDGFLTVRAVVEREGLDTTSSKPRYALESGFAALFDHRLTGDKLTLAISDWQRSHTSKAALARQTLIRRHAVASENTVQVQLPNREQRTLAAGASSLITKAVIEEFSTRFLRNPAVLWISESKRKVIARDEELAKSLGLTINSAKTLPDIILVDLGGADTGTILFVFVEVVASDGPITTERKRRLTKIACDAGFSEDQLAFVTAVNDRDSDTFRRSIVRLAWNSYLWCVCEPDSVIHLLEKPEGVSKIPIQALQRLDQFK